MMGKQKILIADDEPAIINYITDVLENYDYEIYAALNGNNAYIIAQKSQPDLIILDWDMPELNGIETLKKLKANDKTKDILVIMITGVMNSIQNLKIAFQAGAIDFIKKPIDSIELVSRTRSMLMLANYYKQAIKHKDWELTLLTKNILSDNEFNTQLLVKLCLISNHLKQKKEIPVNSLEAIISELKSKIKTQAWEQFETYFKSVHPNFLTSLMKRYPSLTNSEIKLCIFLRLNLNSKEIANITFQNAQSIDIARYRLRKKFHLDRKGNLNTFLMSY